jgi:formyl-CoA transferase
LTATIGALAAWRDVRAGGPGRLVDVSTMEAMAALHQWTLTKYSYQGYIQRRAGNRHAESHHPVAFLECADGWVCIAAAGDSQWQSLVAAAGMPPPLEEERFQTSGGRYDHADEVDGALRPWLLSHSAQEVVDILQARRIPAGVVNEVSRVLGDEHLRARGYLEDVLVGGRMRTMPGSTVRMGGVQWEAAPGIGQHTQAVALEFDAP